MSGRFIMVIESVNITPEEFVAITEIVQETIGKEVVSRASFEEFVPGTGRRVVDVRTGKELA